MRSRRCMAAIQTAALMQAACGGGGGASSSPDQNLAPVIGGTPASVATVGVRYSFTPTASDPDGDRLTFSISGQPAWTDFDAATGQLSGVPPASASGTVDSVRISVSDGSLSSNLSFSITVGSRIAATLTWTKPTRNIDGTRLEDLAGYRVYYGPSPSLGNRLDIGSGDVTSSVIEGLAPGTWYFAMTTVNESGVESDRTGLVSVDL